MPERPRQQLEFELVKQPRENIVDEVIVVVAVVVDGFVVAEHMLDCRNILLAVAVVAVEGNRIAAFRFLRPYLRYTDYHLLIEEQIELRKRSLQVVERVEPGLAYNHHRHLRPHYQEMYLVHMRRFDRTLWEKRGRCEKEGLGGLRRGSYRC